MTDKLVTSNVHREFYDWSGKLDFASLTKHLWEFHISSMSCCCCFLHEQATRLLS